VNLKPFFQTVAPNAFNLSESKMDKKKRLREERLSSFFEVTFQDGLSSEVEFVRLLRRGHISSKTNQITKCKETRITFKPLSESPPEIPNFDTFLMSQSNENHAGSSQSLLISGTL
jgi:hypothetical protein